MFQQHPAIIDTALFGCKYRVKKLGEKHLFGSGKEAQNKANQFVREVNSEE